MTPIERLTAVLARLNALDSDTSDRHASNYSRLTEIASFMDDLADITQQLETAIIELEG